MNLKLAHLVLIQFGIFIGILFCLVVYRFEEARPRTAAAKQTPVTKRAAAVVPLPQSEEQPPDMEDDADSEEADQATEPARTALPNEYSPEAVERMRAEATRLYYEQIAPRRYSTGNAASTTVAAVAPAYTEMADEPAVDQTNLAPEAVTYVQPTQVVVYSQPAQFVVFSRAHRFSNRCRPSSIGAFASNPHRRRAGGNHLSTSTAFETPTSSSAALRRPPGSGVVAHHQNNGVASCAPTQGSGPRRSR